MTAHTRCWLECDGGCGQTFGLIGEHDNRYQKLSTLRKAAKTAGWWKSSKGGNGERDLCPTCQPVRDHRKRVKYPAAFMVGDLALCHRHKREVLLLNGASGSASKSSPLPHDSKHEYECGMCRHEHEGNGK